MKYKDTIKNVVSALNTLGHEPLFPNLDYVPKGKNKAITAEEKQLLAREHYQAIDSADCMYIITQDGYMGTSCTLELGYAIAKEIPIYFSEPTNNLALDSYAREYIPLNALKKFNTLH